MGDTLKRINEYLESDKGRESLHNLGVLVHWAGNAFVFLLSSVIQSMQILNFAFGMIRSIGPAIGKLGHWIAGVAESVGNWFVGVWHSIVDFFTGVWHAITGFFDSVGEGAAKTGDFFSSLWDKLLSGGAAVIDWITALPGRIGDFFSKLPGIVWSAALGMFDAVFYMVGFIAGTLYRLFSQDIPRWVSEGWTWAVAYVEEGATKTWQRIVALPGQIWGALSSFGSTLAGIFRDAWNWSVAYVEEGARRTWARISALPGQIWDALKSLGSTLWGLFRDAWARSNQAISEGVSTALSWFYSLPGKIKNILSSASTWLYNVGKDMLRGLVDGIQDALGWAVNMAKRAAQDIKKGFLDALDINSPSKVMAREVGMPIMEGITYGMKKGLPEAERYIGEVGMRLLGGITPVVNVAAPNVNVGGTTLIADLGEGIRQVVPLAIMNNPRVVAGAAAVGNRQRDGWVNTGRGKGN